MPLRENRHIGVIVEKGEIRTPGDEFGLAGIQYHFGDMFERGRPAFDRTEADGVESRMP